jgi:serpin B
MTASTGQLATADAAFGTDLYTKLARPGNLVFSPASVAAALRMALIGAAGETAAELARAMHLPGPEAARAAQEQFTGRSFGDALTLRVVNTAWIDSGLVVLNDFLRQPVTVERVDFARRADAARLAINTAVEEQTAGKIQDLLAPGTIDELTRLVLVNAVYLRARWEHQFPEANTRKDAFYPQISGSSAYVDMMHMEARLAYHRGDGFQAVLLPYKGGPLAMAIVLPDGPLSTFPLAALGGLAGVLDGLLTDRTQYQVDLRLPKFKVTAKCELQDTLEALGVVRAFRDDADFSGITRSPLKISAVVHQAYIDVDEQGTEAAAATAALMVLAAARRLPPTPRVAFTADRPFLFAIVETTSGDPLFLGQFTRP